MGGKNYKIYAKLQSKPPPCTHSSPFLRGVFPSPTATSVGFYVSIIVLLSWSWLTLNTLSLRLWPQALWGWLCPRHTVNNGNYLYKLKKIFFPRPRIFQSLGHSVQPTKSARICVMIRKSFLSWNECLERKTYRCSRSHGSLWAHVKCSDCNGDISPNEG